MSREMKGEAASGECVVDRSGSAGVLEPELLTTTSSPQDTDWGS
jgi:hypothetical protein